MGNTESEKLELQYQTSLVAMHCEPENIQKLSGDSQSGDNPRLRTK